MITGFPWLGTSKRHCLHPAPWDEDDRAVCAALREFEISRQEKGEGEGSSLRWGWA